MIATPSVTLEPTDAPVATPVSFPAELIGKWRAEISADDIIVLDIKAGSYSIAREASAKGRLELDGAALIFSHGTLCTGDGRYSWTVTGDTLQFKLIGPDACPGRETSIDGVTYVRVN